MSANHGSSHLTPKKLHADEVDTDAALVQRLLAAQFPQWADLSVVPVHSTGTVNVIYRLGDDLCVRLPRIERYARSLDREMEWLPQLAPHLPLAIPEPLVRGEPGEGYPFPWAVYRWIEGETFATDRIAGMDEAAGDIARFIAALRRIDPAGAPLATRREPLAARDEVTRKAIASVAHLFDPGRLVAAWEASLAAPTWDETPGWIHGDLLPANLLVSGGKLTAVIDFGGAGIGDPACDLLPAWCLFTGTSRSVFRDALEVDEGTWLRGRGWALSIALLIIPYYPETNPAFVEMATGMVTQVLEDYENRAPGS